MLVGTMNGEKWKRPKVAKSIHIGRGTTLHPVHARMALLKGQ